MKKEYIQPQMAVRTLKLANIIASSPLDLGLGGDKGGNWNGDAKDEFDFDFEGLNEDLFGNDTWGGEEEW